MSDEQLRESYAGAVVFSLRRALRYAENAKTMDAVRIIREEIDAARNQLIHLERHIEQ